MKRIALLLICTMLLCSCNDNTSEDSNVSESPIEIVEETAASADIPYNYSIKEGEAQIISYLGDETEVTVPNTIEGASVTSIQRKALAKEKITKITFPEGLKECSEFYLPSTLTEISIPSTMEYFDPKTCYSQSSLENITVYEADNGQANYASENGVLYSADMKTLLAVPTKKSGTFSIPEGVEAIGEFALAYAKVNAVVFPSTLRTIEKNALSNRSITQVTFNDGLQYIGDNAFRNSSITEAKLPDTIKGIEDYAFCNTKISELYVPDSCDKYSAKIVDSLDISLSVPYFSEDMMNSGKSEKITARKDSALTNAITKALHAKDDITYYFIDIDGDNFPERISVSGGNNIELSRYDCEENKWLPISIERATGDGFSYIPDRVSRLECCEDTSTGETFWRIYAYFAFLGTEEYYLYYDNNFEYQESYLVKSIGHVWVDDGTEWGYWSDEPVVNDYSADIPPCKVLKEFTPEVLAEKYDVNVPSVVFDGPFAEEPNGKISENIRVFDKTVSEFPYRMVNVLSSNKLFIGEEDILHSGRFPEGVDFDYLNGILTIENLKMSTETGRCIEIEMNRNIDIVLKGENELISKGYFAVFAADNLRFKGDGSLKVSGIISGNSSSVEFCDDVKVDEIKGGIHSTDGIELSGNAEVRCTNLYIPRFGLHLNDDSKLYLGSEEMPYEDLYNFNKIYINDNALFEIVAIDCGIYDHSGQSPQIFISDNGVLDIKCDGEGIDFGDDGGISISDNGRLNIDSKSYSITCRFIKMYGGTIECNSWINVCNTITSGSGKYAGGFIAYGDTTVTYHNKPEQEPLVYENIDSEKGMPLEDVKLFNLTISTEPCNEE